MNKEQFVKEFKEISIERKIIIGMCFLFLILGFFLFMGLKDANSCLGNPLVYGAKQLTNEITQGVYCNCNFLNPRYSPFYFNNETVKTLTFSSGGYSIFENITID